MAIIEKPTGPIEVFATREEAMRHQEPVMAISTSDFNEKLASHEVQDTLRKARSRRETGAGAPSSRA
jgi:hypothetical protein